MMKILPALFIGLVAFTFASAQTEKPAPNAGAKKLPEPVVDAHELMEIFSEPLHEDLKAKMAKQPENDRAWKLLSREGYRAAEIANLIAMREEGKEHAKVWQQEASDAHKGGINLASAAKNKDWAAAQTAYKAIIQSCNSCHQKVAPDHAPKIEP